MSKKNNCQYLTVRGEGYSAWISVKRDSGKIKLSVDSEEAYLTNKEVDELIRMLKEAKVRGD